MIFRFCLLASQVAFLSVGEVKFPANCQVPLPELDICLVQLLDLPVQVVPACVQLQVLLLKLVNPALLPGAPLLHAEQGHLTGKIVTYRKKTN